MINYKYFLQFAANDKSQQSQPHTVCSYKKKLNLIQNSPVVKKVCNPQEGHCEKRCEIQDGSQEMAVMVS